MNKWTEKEERILMNYFESDDSETVQERIKNAHYMTYSKEEGGHPDLKGRTLQACKNRFYVICNKIQKGEF